MERRIRKTSTIDGYINEFPHEIQYTLKKLRNTVKESAPGSEEIISYGMPAFKIHGKILVYFAVSKNHIGFYALPSAIIKFKKELSSYSTSKGTIRFPLDEPIPYVLIRKIVEYRVQENLQKKK